MTQTADASLRSLPAVGQAAVAAVRRQIQATPYDRLDPGPARVVRQRYQRSVAEDRAKGLSQRPVERQVSLELLQRRVPPQRWGDVAARAAVGASSLEPEAIQERVTKMQNVQIQRDGRTHAAPGTPIHKMTAEQEAAAGQREVRRLVEEGLIPGPYRAPEPSRLVRLPDPSAGQER